MDIRPELTSSHDRVWRSLAAPGTWLTAAERVDVAREVRGARDCRFCRERKESPLPMSIEGRHQAVMADMPYARVELIHKLVTDPGRISRAWVKGLFAEGMSDAEYVEISGLVSAVLVVDTFHLAMGLPLRTLPEPEAGEPSKRRPRTAVPDDAYVPMIPADGLVDDYQDLYEPGLPVANVHRAFSLVPEVTRLANDLMASHYFPYEQVIRYTDADHDYAINKTQIELTAARVSRHNDCFY